jgi:hypothetical protein
MAVVVLLVLGAGAAAYGYQQGWFPASADQVTVTALPPCPPAAPASLTPAGVHVNVYNSTPRNGLAASVANDLRERSFVVDTVANDPLHADVTGTALVRYGTKGEEAAKLVQAQVPKSTLRHDKRKGADVDLVLGDAFKRLAAAPTPSVTVSPTPSASCTPAGTPTSETPTTQTATTPTATG